MARSGSHDVKLIERGIVKLCQCVSRDRVDRDQVLQSRVQPFPRPLPHHSAEGGYAKAGTRLARLQDAASASERAADYARLRFEGGVADFLEVMDAERTMLDAQNQLAGGRTDVTTACVAVYKATRGDPAALRYWSGGDAVGCLSQGR